ncbi:uncharacterized protein Dana_GF23650, isoform B [Drosophila ananassae]|uniref:Uncharacterized protein, isoform B n=1 Tax=Drosophila ananassae TaxID=7217 RepID=A0A0N8P142_DROAN|nr:uncharacterized protein LOC6506291 isoform X2 [Drosophila ananassae]KPU78876.1 uncharacterized protein Dana_GF23650, isoform B [Drosophila ananassae]
MSHKWYKMPSLRKKELDFPSFHEEHVKKCVNRSDIWEVTPDESPKTDQKKSVPCEADWDVDEDVPTYTPNLMEKENFVVRSHYGLSRDDGRKFREEERKRFALWQEKQKEKAKDDKDEA